MNDIEGSEIKSGLIRKLLEQKYGCIIQHEDALNLIAIGNGFESWDKLSADRKKRVFEFKQSFDVQPLFPKSYELTDYGDAILIVPEFAIANPLVANILFECGWNYMSSEIIPNHLLIAVDAGVGDRGYNDYFEVQKVLVELGIPSYVLWADVGDDSPGGNEGSDIIKVGLDAFVTKDDLLDEMAVRYMVSKPGNHPTSMVTELAVGRDFRKALAKEGLTGEELIISIWKKEFSEWPSIIMQEINSPTDPEAFWESVRDRLESLYFVLDNEGYYEVSDNTFSLYHYDGRLKDTIEYSDSVNSHIEDIPKRVAERLGIEKSKVVVLFSLPNPNKQSFSIYNMLSGTKTDHFLRFEYDDKRLGWDSL